MTTHKDVMVRVNKDRTDFRAQNRVEINNRYRIYARYHNDDHFRYYYSGWYQHGFYGGYFYPVRPALDIDVDFDYPCVNWMFNPDYDEAYYQAYYPDYDQYPVEADPQVGVYFPTDTVRDLGIDMSAYPAEIQANFRNGMTKMTAEIAQQVSDNLQSSITIGQNELVINHYQNLDGAAVVIEGFFDRDDLHFAFKALVDLQDPNQTLVFVPSSQNPTAEELATLDTMNQRIVRLGGNPFQADQEPTK